MQGRLARLIYRAIQQRHLAALFGVWRAAIGFAGDWLARRLRPRVKLH